MPASGSKRVTADQWLRKALEIFARTGEGGLRVENLARSLNISKSGFYFHFKGRNDFLQKLIDYWAHEFTEAVIDNPLLAMTAPRERLLMISTLVFEQNLTEFDTGMYLWANKEPKIARQVRRVTDMRLAFAGKAFAELGFEGDELEMRSQLFVAYLAIERQIFGPDKKAAKQIRESRLDLLLSKPAPPQDKAVDQQRFPLVGVEQIEMLT